MDLSPQQLRFLSGGYLLQLVPQIVERETLALELGDSGLQPVDGLRETPQIACYLLL